MADLRFGNFLAPNMSPMYRAIADQIGSRLGMTTQTVVESNYETLRNDTYDVNFVCSLPLVILEGQGISLVTPIAAPVLKGDRYGGRPIYFSDVITHRSSKAQSLMDLRGRSWCYNEPLSQSGYGITRYHLLSIGESKGFFGEVANVGFHEESIRLVADGVIDGSAIDSQVLSVQVRKHPELRKQLKVIDSLGPSTIQPMVVSNRLDPALRRDIRKAMLEFHNLPAGRSTLAEGTVERWVGVGRDRYNGVRRMLDDCERAGFMEIR